MIINKANKTWYLALFVLLGWVLTFSSVRANNAEFCNNKDWPHIQQALVGKWEIQHQSGFVQTGNLILPFGKEDGSEIIDLNIDDDKLLVTHPDMQTPLVIVPADEARWSVDSNDPYKPAPVISPDDVAMIFGCDQMNIPRMIGTATEVVEGIEMHFTYRFMSIDRKTMYGLMEVRAQMHGYNSTIKRTFWMEKVKS